MENPNLKWMMTGGTAMTLETPHMIQSLESLRSSNEVQTLGGIRRGSNPLASGSLSHLAA